MISDMRATIGRPASIKELRGFGLLVGSIFAAIGLWPFLIREEPVRLWALGLGAVLIPLGAIWPVVLRPLHKFWMLLGHVLGWVNTRILLGIVFYGLVTPMGAIFRMLGKDTMRQVFAADSPTYRVAKTPRPRGHMKHQF